MEPNILQLSESLSNDLAALKTEPNPVLRSEAALKLIKPVLLEVNNLISSENNMSDELRILHNRETIPEIYGEFLYYSRLLVLEYNKPVGAALKAYYEKQQLVMEDFFISQSDFLKYYRSGKQNLDEYYFGQVEDHLFSADVCLLGGPNLNVNPYSLQIAQSNAYERLLCFILEALNIIDGKHFVDEERTAGLEWTASKTDLVELIYAFYAAGVFDNGKTTISELITYVEKIIGIRLGNTSVTFQEILRRKQSTVFLDRLKNKLEIYMNKIEERVRI